MKSGTIFSRLAAHDRSALVLFDAFHRVKSILAGRAEPEGAGRVIKCHLVTLPRILADHFRDAGDSGATNEQ